MSDISANASLVINGVTMPMPASMTIGYQDVDYDSGRTADGTMHRNRVGQKVKLSIEWPHMHPAEVKKVLQAVKPTWMQVTYLDAETNSRKTKTMYAGDRSSPVYNYTLGLYSPISVDLIER